MLALTLALAAGPSPALATPRPSIVDIDAEARAAGNRRADAVRLARVLLAHTWPVQVLKVRIDGEGHHAVAGLTLSGVKFHGSVDENTFIAEVEALVERTFGASDVEEVDVWAAIPIKVPKATVVAGDYAQPTSRIVFSATLRRADAARSVAQKLLSGEAVYWDPAWRALLAKRAK